MYGIILNSITFMKGTIHDDFKTICLKQYIIHIDILFMYLHIVII